MNATTTKRVARRAAAIVGVAAIGLSVTGAPAPAATVDYVATCRLGELSMEQIFTLSGDVEAGPVTAAGPVKLTNLVYSDDFAAGYRIQMVFGEDTIDLGLTDGPELEPKFTDPVDGTITAPAKAGPFAVVPDAVIVTPEGADFDMRCDMTTAPGPIGTVMVEAATATTQPSPTTTVPVTPTPPSTPPTTGAANNGVSTGGGASPAVPVKARPTFTG